MITHSASGGTSADLAFDGNFGTCWEIGSNSGWLQTTFDTPVVLMGYSITSMYNTNQSPRNFQFEGSNDGITWVVLNSYREVIFGSNNTKTYLFRNTTPYLYGRINVLNTRENWLQISEMTIIHDVPLAQFSNYSDIGNSNAQDAFDGDVNTVWSYPARACWIQAIYNLPITIDSYTIKSHANTNQSPMDFDFLGSNDGSAWSILDSQRNIWLGSFGSQNYILAVKNSYLFYRLNVLNTRADCC